MERSPTLNLSATLAELAKQSTQMKRNAVVPLGPN